MSLKKRLAALLIVIYAANADLAKKPNIKVLPSSALSSDYGTFSETSTIVLNGRICTIDAELKLTSELSGTGASYLDLIKSIPAFRSSAIPITFLDASSGTVGKTVYFAFAGNNTLSSTGGVIRLNGVNNGGSISIAANHSLRIHAEYITYADYS